MALCTRINNNFLKFPINTCSKRRFDRDPAWFRNLPSTPKEFYDRLKHSFAVFPKYCKLVRESYSSKFKEPYMPVRHLNYKMLANFREMDNEKFSKWSISTDKTIDGLSTASFVKHPERGTAIFSGNLETKVPDTGTEVRSGMVNVKSPNKVSIFHGFRTYDFANFNFFLIRYRGDGRSYALNVHKLSMFDFEEYDISMFPLYTRGGPLWQTEKIPFHKFYLTSKGRILDVQNEFRKASVQHISVTLMDAIAGPFNLEIDYIALLREHGYNEQFSYETYFTSMKGQRFK